jgi:hypothetical protein
MRRRFGRRTITNIKHGSLIVMIKPTDVHLRLVHIFLPDNNHGTPHETATARTPEQPSFLPPLHPALQVHHP